MTIMSNGLLRPTSLSATSAALRPDVQPRTRVRISSPVPDMLSAVPAPIIIPAPAPEPLPSSATASTSPERSYEVGYGKPPKSSQFKKGKSGNPKGRPKGAKGLNTIARKVLLQKVQLRTSEGLEKVCKTEAVLHKVVEQAVKGNMRASQIVLRHHANSIPDEALTAAQPALPAGAATMPAIDMDAHDRAILAEFERMLLARFAPSGEEAI